MRSMSEDITDTGQREAIRQIIAPAGEARPDEQNQKAKEKWPEQKRCYVNRLQGLVASH